MKYLHFCIIFLILLTSPTLSQLQPLSHAELMTYIKEAADSAWIKHPAEVKRWRESIDTNYVFGYNPPGTDPILAGVCAELYRDTKDRKYSDRAKQLLIEYGEYKKAYPVNYFRKRLEYAKGLPALPNIFLAPSYMRAYRLLKDENVLSSSEKAIVERNIAESADFLLNFQEWGPMNRAMLRAETLMGAVKTVPNHPNARMWEMMARAIANDSWAKWEIEDASLYNGVWLYSLFSYADILQDESLFRTPIIHYYLNYYTHLICPDGSVPEFGDSGWKVNWDRFMVCLEKGAAVYKDPTMKYAAMRLYHSAMKPNMPRNNIWLAQIFYDCIHWGDETIKPEAPEGKSEEVLEDIVGKKVVFRNGYGENDTYLLLNYRDEGDGGLLFRDYLRNTIPVEEEKMHHGHSDENSIPLLMSGGSVLLRDGGYRDFMPSGPYGAYRQDYFHNRVAVRKNKLFKGQKEGEERYANSRKAVPGQGVLEFFHNSGAYRKVRTEKIDFLWLKHFDMSRTRVTDDKIGYQHDRIVNWVKDLNIFVVFDVLKFTVEDYYTAANLWHTRKILSRGERWYDTVYDSLGSVALPTNTSLLVYFPEKGQRMEGMESEKRNYQNEWVMYQLDSRHCDVGDLITFTTILIPHESGADIQKFFSSVKMVDVSYPTKTVGVKIESGGTVYYVCAKLDLQMDIVRDYRRPKYTYESGKVRFDDFETDGSNVFAVVTGKRIEYCITNTVKGTYKGHVLYEQQPANFGLAFDGSPEAPGAGKVRYWEDVYTMK
jgi:hypothetical protein